MSDQAHAVERWLAWRYLANRQREGFVSAIAIFSLIGVALGVATLIVVLSVMGGFRQELIGRIIGMNGHVVIAAKQGMVEATPALLEKLRANVHNAGHLIASLAYIERSVNLYHTLHRWFAFPNWGVIQQHLHRFGQSLE